MAEDRDSKPPDPVLQHERASKLTVGQPYGDLTELNTNRTILDAVGKTLLRGIADDFFRLLETSTVIYEGNGDYAMGIMASGWCRLMDQASRKRCGTEDNRQALASGRWHCHESCWQISRTAMTTGQPADQPCLGGIRIYAAPIRLGDQVIGAINFGYGDPPRDREALRELAARYGCEADHLLSLAREATSVPPEVVEQAKSRLATAAKMIGEIVQRKRFEQALQESEARFRQLAETLDDVVWLHDLARNRILYLNPAYEKIWGRPVRDVYENADAWIDAVHPEDRPRILRAWNLEVGGKAFDEIYRVIRPDGSVRLVHDRGYPVRDRDGRVYRLAGIVEDITDRRHVESELRLREQKLLQAIEERDALSRDLHDGVLQALYAVGLEIDNCKHLITEAPDRAVARMNVAIGQLNAVIGQVRQFITGLEKPHILTEDIRLALQQVVAGFSQLGHMKVRLDLDPECARSMKPAQTAQLASVVHEALSNSLRHGHARTAEVILSQGDRGTVMELRDDGIGFDVDLSKGRGRGLQNMAVRVGKLEGELVIRSTPGQGTHIVITLPS